jgi:uncharacterized membrane protein
MDLKKINWNLLYYILMGVMLITSVILFVQDLNGKNDEYKYNCFENDTVKKITSHFFICKEINCTSRSCTSYLYDIDDYSYLINITETQ